MKWKKLFPCLLACALLGLTACAKSGPEPVFSHLDTAQITSGEVHNWSIAYWTEMTQEDVERIGPLLQEVEGTLLPNDQREPYTGVGGLPPSGSPCPTAVSGPSPFTVWTAST